MTQEKADAIAAAITPVVQLQQNQIGFTKTKSGHPKMSACVGATYFSGPSPAKYRGQKRA